MSTVTTGYVGSGHGGGAGGCGTGGGGGGDKRRPDPHGKDHPNAGPCPRCGFDMGSRAHRSNMVHRLGQSSATCFQPTHIIAAEDCPRGCRLEFKCRCQLQYHVWYYHRNITTQGFMVTPQTGSVVACHECGCAWYASDDQYMQNHPNYH
ncbi:hypothetical protein AURDEDRAFT_122745 [Auricularia subglabra TFB-10046 SS5]|nr:hypothetical protein AURDEDRAFT_122745 [Auricularia subglabra TFB-10046 SS5]